MQIRPYLNFRGQCAEAVKLYTKAFQTSVKELMRFSDIPPNPNAPTILEEQKNWILQATITFGDHFIRLSDCTQPINESESDRVAIAVECTVDEVKYAFAVLAEEGEVGIPLQQSFFSPCYGVIYDKFGIMWNLVGQ